MVRQPTETTMRLITQAFSTKLQNTLNINLFLFLFNLLFKLNLHHTKRIHITT